MHPKTGGHYQFRKVKPPSRDIRNVEAVHQGTFMGLSNSHHGRIGSQSTIRAT